MAAKLCYIFIIAVETPAPASLRSFEDMASFELAPASTAEFDNHPPIEGKMLSQLSTIVLRDFSIKFW